MYNPEVHPDDFRLSVSVLVGDMFSAPTVSRGGAQQCVGFDAPCFTESFAASANNFRLPTLPGALRRVNRVTALVFARAHALYGFGALPRPLACHAPVPSLGRAHRALPFPPRPTKTCEGFIRMRQG